VATVESSADLARWLDVATSASKLAGTVTLIHRSDRLTEIATLLARRGWGELTVKALRPPARVVVRARRTGKPARREAPPLVLHRPDGGYTDEAEAILRQGRPLAF